jgi:hypothetical protein
MTNNRLPSKKLKNEKSPIVIENHYLDNRRGSKTPVLTRKVPKKSRKFMNFDSSNQEAFMSVTMRFASPIIDKCIVPAKDLVKTAGIPVKSRNNPVKYLTYSEQASIAKSNRDYIHAQKVDYSLKNDNKILNRHQSQVKIIKNSLITTSTNEDNSFAGSFVTKIPSNKYENQHTDNSYKNTFTKKKFSKIFCRVCCSHF